jgi:hypothetical protein
LREASADDKWLDHCAQWYLHYAHVRYAGDTTHSGFLLLYPRARSSRFSADTAQDDSRC